MVGFIICFIFAEPIFLFLVQPFQTAMALAHPERAGQAIELINTGAFGFFSVKMQIALFAGDRARLSGHRLAGLRLHRAGAL